jgi:soluble lytic murein transglycosylase-like protein
MIPKIVFGLVWVLSSLIAGGLGAQMKHPNLDTGYRVAQKTADYSPSKDPWRRLQALYLPFSWQMEKAALKDKAVAKKVGRQLYQRLSPYRKTIRSAAKKFKIPEAVIGAVIMVESAGNSRAKAKTSSAKGLMQTIDSTFYSARKGLAQMGINIANSPYDPHASIMAGSWYLDRMYAQVLNDHHSPGHQRGDVNSWQKALEYYYAGPYHGRNKEPVVITYAGGRQIVIDKAAYSRKVLQWANLMQVSGRFG